MLSRLLFAAMFNTQYKRSRNNNMTKYNNNNREREREGERARNKTINFFIT